MEILTWAEFAQRLGLKKETFRRQNWRAYRHTFVGKGRNLRSARFAWHEDGSHLEWQGGPNDAGYADKRHDADRYAREDHRRRRTPKGNSKDDNTALLDEFDVFKNFRLPDGSIRVSPYARKQ